MASGGYRKPTNPAPVSGPGAHSRRTDGQPSMKLPNAQYGEGKEFTGIEAGAKLASASNAPSAAPAGPASSGSPSFIGLGAPSQQPDTPVTAGAAMGAGPGLEALGIRGAGQDAEQLRQYLPVLIDIAQRDDTLPGTKQWVRNIIATLG
jgi:hypothetical protein